MAERFSERQEDGVAILTLPDALSRSVCATLSDALARTIADPALHGIVLAGGAAGFDLEESDLPGLAKAFAALSRAIETARKPIVAILSGATRNEGLELALCAHARVATSDARLAMTAPELGLIPGGGGTQRLPRAIGPEAALHLMLTGEVWPISDRRLQGLAQSVVQGDADLVAIKTARNLLGPPVTREPEPSDYQDALANARARRPNPSPAEADIIACVEAAQLLPLPQGLAFETARFVDRSQDRAARLLRHAARASARAEPRAPARQPENVVVMGRSSETADLAAMALEQGHRVWIEAGSPAMGEALGDVTRKRLRPSWRRDTDVQARLTVDLTGAEMEGADLVLDTAELTPDPPVALKPGAVWIVTSPDVTAADRAAEVGATGQTLRLRRLLRASHVVELSAPPETGQESIETAHAALSAAGQSVILTADTPGGLLGALFCAVARAALVMLAAGRDAGAIEAAARDLGLQQGPLQMIDVLGAGRSLAQMRRVYTHRGVSMAPLRVLSARMADVTDGDAARARRALVFHAPAGQSFVRDPDLSDWLREWRADHPDRAIPWPDIDLRSALHAALIAEAARLLQDKVVTRASDIDLAAQKGLLMSVHKGGPLIQADLSGLLGVARVLDALEETDGAVWTREPLIDDMVKNGQRFF